MRWSRWNGQAGSMQRVSASPSSLHERCPQRARAHRGERPRLGAVGAQAEDRADHLGDHVAGLAHDDRVAGPHVLQADLVLVVQRRDADRGATDEHRIEHGEGRGPTGATDRHLDVAQQRGALLGRELERDGPARGLGGDAEELALGQLVDLHHGAVDLVVEVVAVRLPALRVARHVGEGLDLADLGVHRDAELAEEVERVVVARERRAALDVAELVGPQRQLAAGGDRADPSGAGCRRPSCAGWRTPSGRPRPGAG